MANYYSTEPESLDERSNSVLQKHIAQLRKYQEQEKKKRNHAGMMQANQDRPKSRTDMKTKGVHCDESSESVSSSQSLPAANSSPRSHHIKPLEDDIFTETGDQKTHGDSLTENIYDHDNEIPTIKVEVEQANYEQEIPAGKAWREEQSSQRANMEQVDGTSGWNKWMEQAKQTGQVQRLEKLIGEAKLIKQTQLIEQANLIEQAEQVEQAKLMKQANHMEQLKQMQQTKQMEQPKQTEKAGHVEEAKRMQNTKQMQNMNQQNNMQLQKNLQQANFSQVEKQRFRPLQSDKAAVPESRLINLKQSIEFPIQTQAAQYALIKQEDIFSGSSVIDLRKFVLQPARKGDVVQCRITRDKKGLDRAFHPLYYMHLERDNKEKVFILAARKGKSPASSYLMSTNPTHMTRDGDDYVGRLRSNILRSEFTVCDGGCKPKMVKNASRKLRCELGAVIYENTVGFSGHQEMTILIPGMNVHGKRIDLAPKDEDDGLINSWKTKQMRNILELRSKPPMWDRGTRTYGLNYHGRVTRASAKNFQIVHSSDVNYIVMQFGRAAEEVFRLDYQYPMCAVQAFGIALTVFNG